MFVQAYGEEKLGTPPPTQSHLHVYILKNKNNNL